MLWYNLGAPFTNALKYINSSKQNSGLSWGKYTLYKVWALASHIHHQWASTYPQGQEGLLFTISHNRTLLHMICAFHIVHTYPQVRRPDCVQAGLARNLCFTSGHSVGMSLQYFSSRAQVEFFPVSPVIPVKICHDLYFTLEDLKPNLESLSL